MRTPSTRLWQTPSAIAQYLPIYVAKNNVKTLQKNLYVKGLEKDFKKGHIYNLWKRVLLQGI
jgi:hypothetical protein